MQLRLPAFTAAISVILVFGASGFVVVMRKGKVGEATKLGYGDWYDQQAWLQILVAPIFITFIKGVMCYYPVLT